MPNQQLPLRLFRKQAPITQYERDHRRDSFGEITPAKLRTILDDAHDGDTREWIELCKHATKTDGHLFDLLDTRKKRALEALEKHHIVPGRSLDPTAQAMAGKAALLCETVLSNIRPFKTKVSKILDAIGDGFSATELDWGIDHGLYVVKDLIWVHSRRFRWDDDWQLRLYDYGIENTQYGEELIPDCWLVVVSLDEGVYPGEAGVIQRCIWPWLFKMWVNRYHIHATERYGQPFISATVPAGSKPSVRTQVLAKLEQLSYDTVGVFEEGTEVVFQGGPSQVNNGEMFEKYLERADKTQTKAVLGATDIVDQGERGSQAAVSERIEATLDPKTAIDVELFFEALENQVFEPLIRYNISTHFGGVFPPIPRWESKSLSKVYDVQGAAEATDDISGPAEIARQETTLNGAQIASLVEVIQNIGAGTITRDGGISLIEIAFNLSSEQAKRIVGDIGLKATPQVVNPEEIKKVPDTTPAMSADIDQGKKKLNRSHSKTSTQRTFRFSTNPLATALSGESGDSGN